MYVQLKISTLLPNPLESSVFLPHPELACGKRNIEEAR
jgi:hypothetical protein